MKKRNILIFYSFVFSALITSLTFGSTNESATPPTFDFADFCENESGFPSNVNPPGGTFSFAPNPGDGSMIDPATGEVTNAVGGSTYSIQYTAPGPGGGSSIVQVMVNPIPTYSVLTSVCDAGNNTWTVTFMTDANQIAANFATIPTPPGGMIYTASNIPLTSNLIMTLTFNSTLCEVDVTIMPPLPCNCPIVPDPPTPGDTAYLCQGSQAPIISATAGVGLVIDWYDAATGGTLLASATNTYQTTSPGTFYAEARDPATGCVSDRVPVVVVFVPIVPINASGITCQSNGTVTFDIVFFLGDEADSVTVSVGDVVNNNDGTFSVSNVPWGSSITITIIYFSTGCAWSSTITMPTCCHLLDPPISLGDTTVCEGTSPFPFLSVDVGAGYSANWYDQASGGSPVATSTTSYMPLIPGTYWVATYDPISGCESTTRIPIFLAVQPYPTFDFISDSCNTTTELYTFTFSASTGTTGVLISAGTLVFTGNIYQISDLVGGTSFSLSLFSQIGCETDTTFIVPICVCTVISPPVSGGDLTYCPGDPLPTLSATVPAGFTIDWYDVMTGGTRIAIGSTTFTPTTPGTYYAEAREISSDCISDMRTPIQLTVLPVPTFILDSLPCVQSTTHSIYFTTDAAIIMSDQGTVSNVINEHYEIAGCVVGTATLITLESANGCIIDTLIQSPLCNCPPLAPPISLGDTTICEGAPFPFLEVSVSSGYTVNWYALATGGTPLATSTTTYTPLVAGTYYASTVDPGFICESLMRTPVTLTVESIPFINMLSDSCNTNTQLYSFSFMTDAIAIAPNSGTLTSIGATIYEISDLVSGTTFSMIVTTLAGCQHDTTFIVPACDCPSIPPPISSGDQFYCFGEAIPVLIASVPAGFTIDWFDVANGGQSIATGSLSFTPTLPGIYYAEARELNSDCTSNMRTPIELIILPLPSLIIDSIRCTSSIAYDIYITTTATNVISSQGFVNSPGNEVYIIQNCVASTSTLIMLESIDGCITDTLIESPNCDCPLLGPPFVSADTFYCEGAVIPLLEAQTNSTFQIDWYDAVLGGNLLLSNSSTYQPTGPGMYYAEVFDPLSGCSSIRVAVRLDVISLPSFAMDSIFCVDTSFYSVRFISDASSISFDLGVASSPDTNTYVIAMIPSGFPITISVFSAEQCAVDTIIPTLNCGCPTIPAPVSVGDTTFCQNDIAPPIVATSLEGHTINWFDATIGGAAILAGSDTLVPPGAGTYYAEAIDSTSGCRSNVRTAIRVVALPLPTFILDSMVCRADLTGYSLYFQSNANFINFSLDVTVIFNGAQYVADSIASGLNITFGLVDSNGCQSDTTITGLMCDCPLVDPPVSVGDELYCEGSSTIPLLNVTATNGIRYDWFDAASGGTLLSGNTSSLQLDSARVVYVEAIDISTGCTSTTRTIIQLIELPLPSFTLDSIRCQHVDYYEVYISTDGTPAASVGNLQSLGLNAYLIDSIPSSSNTELTISSASCSLDTSIAALVCDCPLIDPPGISNDTTICFGAPFPVLTASSTNGNSINWYDAAVNGTLILENSTTYTPMSSGTYFAEVIDDQTGCTSTLRSAVTITEAALITLDLPMDVTTCLLTGALEVTTSGDDIFWTALDGAILMNNMGRMVDYILPDFGTYQIEVEASSQACQVLDTLRITTTEFAVNINTDPPNCLDTLGLITLNGPVNEGPYSLIENNNPAITFLQFPYTMQRPTGAYQFVIENNIGCSQTFGVDIPQIADLFLDLGPDLEGETDQAFTLNIQANFTPSIYDWNSTIGLFDFNSLTPQVILDESYTYILTATDSTGCSASDSISVSVLNAINVFIPNAFSPNNDGINERFTLYSNGDPLVEQFQIFNRWGGIMFERAGVNLSQLEGWSGYQNEKLAGPGVYVYAAKLSFPDGSSRFYSGELTLIR